MADELRLYCMNALVTGAAGGIGEATARTLVKQGAEVLAIDAPNSGIDSQFKAVRGITGVVVDVQAADAAAQVAQAAKAEFKRLDIVICDVNPRVNAPINDGDISEVDALLERKQHLVSGICSELLPSWDFSGAYSGGTGPRVSLVRPMQSPG